MTTSAKSRSAPSEPLAAHNPGRLLVRFLPAWIMLALVLTVLIPNALLVTFGASGRALTGTTNWAMETVTGETVGNPAVAPLFTDEIQHWADDIARWSAQYNLDPNLFATVMQIESCGLAEVSSSAGAQGLFQVMPFHFEAGEVYTDPNTNALRGANHLNDCLRWSNGDAGLALACYNAGPSVINRPFANWPHETQRYYNWGVGIYNDARQFLSESTTLDSWLGAGGTNLCSRAAVSQGRTPTSRIIE